MLFSNEALWIDVPVRMIILTNQKHYFNIETFNRIEHSSRVLNFNIVQLRYAKSWLWAHGQFRNSLRLCKKWDA